MESDGGMVAEAGGGEREAEGDGGEAALGSLLVVPAGGTMWKVVVGEGTYSRTYYEQGSQC
jgi:hypothetical protein